MVGAAFPGRTRLNPSRSRSREAQTSCHDSGHCRTRRGAGWFAAKHWPARPVEPSSGGRKVLFYQSAMHPWIKADQPGKCTICGMNLVPVYEGDKGIEVGEGLVTLSSNSITVNPCSTDEVRRQSLRHTMRVAG